jgi:PTS system cellobiose-specific IIC component
MEQKVVPVSNKISSNRYLKSVSNGSMMLLSVIMIGSIFTVISGISWEPYQSFLTSTGIGTFLGFVPAVTIDLLALYMAFSIAYCAANQFDISDSAVSCGIVSLVCYVLLTQINTTAVEGSSFLDFDYLGAKGVIVAIFVSLITTQIIRFFVKRNITIRMPKGVPPMVINSFIALIPAIVAVTFFGLIKIGMLQTSYGTLQGFIYATLQIPLQTLTGSLPAFLVLIFVANLLWFFGVHGSFTVLPILFPIFLGYLQENTAAVAAGTAIPNAINFGLYDLACLGGAGATIGLVLIMFFFSKSKRYKVFSKVVLPCGLFGVNEPLIFGMPIMLNVMLLIPFLLAPIVIVSLGYGLISLGIITPTIGVLGAGSLPPFIHGLAQGSLSFGIYELFATLISALIYFPFFKMLDKQAYKEELAEQLED